MIQAIRRGKFTSTLTHRRGREEQKLCVGFINTNLDRETPAQQDGRAGARISCPDTLRASPPGEILAGAPQKVRVD